jgi:hypothetical protein
MAVGPLLNDSIKRVSCLDPRPHLSCKLSPGAEVEKAMYGVGMQLYSP